MKNNDWHSSFGKGREAGRAGILLELKSCLVTVKHSETLEVLKSIPSRKGDWNKLFEFLTLWENTNNEKTE